MINFLKKHKIFIVIATFIGSPILVILMTTLSIINVNTDNQWIGFWGNYLGAIIGGILGISGAIFVLTETLHANQSERTRIEILSFCDYLVKTSNAYAQQCNACLYQFIDYKNVHTSSNYTGREKINAYKDFLKIHHDAKIILLELMQHLEIRSSVPVYQTKSFNLTRQTTAELLNVFNGLEENIEALLEENDNLWKGTAGDITNKLQEFMDAMGEYEKELFKYATK